MAEVVRLIKQTSLRGPLYRSSTRAEAVDVRRLSAGHGTRPFVKNGPVGKNGRKEGGGDDKACMEVTRMFLFAGIVSAYIYIRRKNGNARGKLNTLLLFISGSGDRRKEQRRKTSRERVGVEWRTVQKRSDAKMFPITSPWWIHIAGHHLNAAPLPPSHPCPVASQRKKHRTLPREKQTPNISVSDARNSTQAVAQVVLLRGYINKKKRENVGKT